MKLTNILIGLLLTGAMTSCEMDFLPNSEIPQEESFKSVKDLQNLVNGGYAHLRGRSYGPFVTYADLSGDLFNATPAYGNRLGSMYRWDLNPSSEEISNIWGPYYTMLANVNNVITGAEKIVPGEKETDIYYQNVGEAYFMRAYVYYNLVNLYGKAYWNEATGTADNETLGVPLNLEYNIEQKLPRSTVKAVYEQVLADLSKVDENWAKVGNFSASDFDGSPSRFTPDALSAFRARVYLSMGEWKKAIAAAEEVIIPNAYPLLEDSEFTDMWKNDKGSEILMHLYIDETETPNQNSSYLGYIANTDTYAPDFIPTKGFVDMYEDSDIRKTAYFLTYNVSMGAVTLPPLTLFNKFPLTKKFSATGNYAHSPILFRSAELYLIAAEAAAREGNNTKALEYLNKLRAARGLAAAPGTDLLNEIKEERIRELAGEGFYLYDLKRWNRGIDRKAMGVQHDNAVVLSGSDLQVPAGDFRFVWAIPAYDMGLNKHLLQNTGW